MKPKVNLSLIRDLLIPSELKNLPLINLEKNFILDTKLSSLPVFDLLQDTPANYDEIYEITLKSRVIEKEIVSYLTSALNQFHNLNGSEKYWQIVVGKWIRNYLNIVWRCFRNIQHIEAKYEIENIITPKCIETTGFVSSNSVDFAEQLTSDLWIANFYVEIFQFTKIHASKLTYVECGKCVEVNTKIADTTSWKIVSLRKTSDYIQKVFGKDTDAMVSSTFLSLKAEMLLQLMLKQPPRFENSEYVIPVNKQCNTIREKLSNEICLRTGNNVEERFSWSYLFKFMPTCFIEDFDVYLAHPKWKHWPQKPKFILTANRFEYDDLFRIYTASKVDKGVPYFVLQHGANYGTNRFDHPTVEEETATKFFTWGWDKKRESTNYHYHPFFITRNYGKKYRYRKYSSKYLFISQGFSSRAQVYSEIFELETARKISLNFFKQLNSELRKEFIVRVYPSEPRKVQINDINWWVKNMPDAEIDLGKSTFLSVIRRCKFFVFEYESTGFYELIAHDVPCMVICGTLLEQTRNEFTDLYRIMLKANIFHLDGASAARHLNAIHSGIEEWWQSNDVKEAKSLFKDSLVKSDTRLLSKLRQDLVRNGLNSDFPD